MIGEPPIGLRRIEAGPGRDRGLHLLQHLADGLDQAVRQRRQHHLPSDRHEQRIVEVVAEPR
jgi:hypothetical protein